MNMDGSRLMGRNEGKWHNDIYLSMDLEMDPEIFYFEFILDFVNSLANKHLNYS